MGFLFDFPGLVSRCFVFDLESSALWPVHATRSTHMHLLGPCVAPHAHMNFLRFHARLLHLLSLFSQIANERCFELLLKLAKDQVSLCFLSKFDWPKLGSFLSRRHFNVYNFPHNAN